jgi:uncharacterized protein with von Willebrand factor type A (vWA) domain
VGTGRILTFCRAASALAPLEPGPLYWAGRATLVGRKEHFETYDRVFRSYFSGSVLEEALEGLLSQRQPVPPEEALASDTSQAFTALGLPDDDEGDGEGTLRLVASRGELLRHKSFEDLSAAERQLAAALIREISVRIPMRRSRRLRPARAGASFDLRRTLRSSLRTEGEPFRRAWRARTPRTRPLLLLLDVSGSMSAYARALMQFGFAARRAGQRVEVFCFGTRLTRVTRALATADPDLALANVASTVADWEGGTRIGDSLRDLLDVWSSRVALRGSVAVICSDGLERGDPALLEAQMARLGRLAHRVVWVNPLKGAPQYEPLARGMAAALPHIDVFLAGHNVASLEVLAETIGR